MIRSALLWRNRRARRRNVKARTFTRFSRSSIREPMRRSITRFGDPRAYAPVSRDLRVYDARGRAGGFTARYYVDGKLKVERTEPDIDKLNVVWEGRVETRRSGVHKFQL